MLSKMDQDHRHTMDTCPGEDAVCFLLPVDSAQLPPGLLSCAVLAMLCESLLASDWLSTVWL